MESFFFSIVDSSPRHRSTRRILFCFSSPFIRYSYTLKPHAWFDSTRLSVSSVFLLWVFAILTPPSIYPFIHLIYPSARSPSKSRHGTRYRRAHHLYDEILVRVPLWTSSWGPRSEGVLRDVAGERVPDSRILGSSAPHGTTPYAGLPATTTRTRSLVLCFFEPLSPGGEVTSPKLLRRTTKPGSKPDLLNNHLLREDDATCP